ncbi:phage distal tail protein [Embleya sp. NPDC050154]|uniref:phage distal tail protein n=1 Tax=Embleya sp. NPDC050154 TaxID=3363988 RepID=UPI0037BB8C63
MFDQQRIGRITWQGLTFGPGSRYHVTEVAGVDDLPALRLQDVARVGDHGDYLGTDYAEPRHPTLSLGLRGDDADELRGLVQALKRATGVGATGPLVFVDWGVQVEARLRRRSIPYDAQALWRLGTAALEWVCPDPRVYEITERSATTGLPVAEAGIQWGTGPEGLDWGTGPEGLDWGSAGSTGGVSVVNSGDAPTHPTIEFGGPVTRPSITNLATGDVLEYDIALGVGDLLVVDTAAGTVRLGGQDRLHTITARSVPETTFVLAPGTSDLAFRADDSGPTSGTVTVRWRSAMW